MKMKVKKMVFLLLLIISFIFFDYNYSYNDYWANPNEKSRIYSAVALWETGDFSFSKLINEEKWQPTMDFATAPNGKMYSDKAPLTVLLAVPLYAPFKLISLIKGKSLTLYFVIMWMRFCMATIPFLITLLFLFKILKLYVSEENAYLALFLFIFATMNFSFSFIAFGHILAQMFIVLCLYFMLVKKNHFLSGAFIGLAFITEYPMAIVVLAMFIFTIILTKDKKEILRFIGGVAPSIVILMIYNWAVWGSPIALSYQFVQSHGVVEEAFWRISFKQIYEVLIGPSRGFFFYSSIFGFSIYGAILMIRKKKPEAILFAILIALQLIFLFGFKEYAGGWSPGIRHLIPTLPLWTIFLAFAMKDIENRKSGYKIAFYSLAVLSIIMNVLPKMAHVFYPDKTPNPTYWSGFYYVKFQVSEILFFDIFKGKELIIKWMAFLAILISLFVLSFKWFIKQKFDKNWMVSTAIGIALFVGILFLPQQIKTESMNSLFGLTGSMGNIYLNDIYSGRKARIKTKFKENQEVADLCFHQAASYSLFDRWLSYSNANLSLIENVTNISQKEKDLRIKYYKKYIQKIKKLQAINKSNYTIDRAAEMQIRKTRTKYNDEVLSSEDKLEAQKMFEYMFYAYMLDGLWNQSSAAYNGFMMLQKSWY